MSKTILALFQGIDVKDNWVNMRATMDTGAAGHVMPAEMFPRAKLDRTNAAKKFSAANGERIKDLGKKTIPFKSVEGVHGCITCMRANVVKSCCQSSWHSHQAGREQRGVHDGHVDYLRRNRWFQLAGTVSGPSVTHKLVRPRTKYSSDSEESCAEQELYGLEEGEDTMKDEEGEGAAGTADWRVRTGPRNKPTAQEMEEHEATQMPFRDWRAHCMMGRGRTHSSPCVEETE